MALIDELKERLSYKRKTIQHLEAQLDEMQEEAGDLDCAIAALEPPPAAVTEPEEQGCRDYSDGSEFDQSTLPSAEDVRGILADDASEFAEEGYAPVIEAEPLADPIWNEPEPEPTDPQADALAKAADYYSPEAVAERNKFNPFAMFRKEDGQ